MPHTLLMEVGDSEKLGTPTKAVLLIVMLLMERASNEIFDLPPDAQIIKYGKAELPGILNCGIVYVALDVVVWVDN